MESTSPSRSGPIDDWFRTGPGMRPVFEGNEVTALVDGEQGYAAIGRAIASAIAPGDFIYMVNWFCDLSVPLLQSATVDELEGEITLRRLLERASAAGVMIRALLWKEPDSTQNAPAVEFINGVPESGKKAGRPGLPNAAAIHDDRGDKPFSLFGIRIIGSIPRALGAQHQKILCVYAAGRLTSFCGGMDFNRDRIAAVNEPAEEATGMRPGGTPLHDVHCRIEGPAALELVEVFAEKWNGHPDGERFNATLGPLIMPPKPAPRGDHLVQIGVTYKPGVYRFCPNGEFSAPEMIAHAIRRARRFIYAEDQYFTGAPLLQAALLEALESIEHLTVLITDWEISDLPYVNEHRRRFIAALTAKPSHAKKVRIFTLQPQGNTIEFQRGNVEHTYVHSKAWIFDDELAVIGSLNANQRSWMHDTEVTAGIRDRSANVPGRFRFAQALRISLWQEHLGMHATGDADALADGVSAAAFWDAPPAGARVRPYDPVERNAAGANDKLIRLLIPQFIAGSDLVWNNFLDPR